MLNNKRYSPKRAGWMGIMGLMFGLALIVSACGGAPVNSEDASPVSGQEAYPSTGGSTQWIRQVIFRPPQVMTRMSAR